MFISMIKGTVFEATDRLGRTFTYQYDETDPEVVNTSNIGLWNMDTQKKIFVELEWFKQRKLYIKKGYVENHNYVTD